VNKYICMHVITASLLSRQTGYFNSVGERVGGRVDVSVDVWW
jgi:hypothetical protein